MTYERFETGNLVSLQLHFYFVMINNGGFVAQMVKNLLTTQETLVGSLGREDSLVGKIPWRKGWLPIPVYMLSM